MKIQDLLNQAKPCWKYAVFNSNMYPRGWMICKNKPFIQGCGWFTNNQYFSISALFDIEPFDGDWKDSLICREGRTTKRRGVRCSEVCCVWDAYDKDCDIMGENHLHPRICPIFKEQDSDLWKKFFEEKKDDNA